jgi:hypothetical protein
LTHITHHHGTAGGRRSCSQNIGRFHHRWYGLHEFSIAIVFAGSKGNGRRTAQCSRGCLARELLISTNVPVLYYLVLLARVVYGVWISTYNIMLLQSNFTATVLEHMEACLRFELGN